MKIIQTSNIIGDAESFFEENCMLKKNYTSGKHNESVDGTGVKSSISDTIGCNIARYIKDKFVCNDQLKVIDVGTGVGHLVEQMNKAGIDGYGIEGSSSAAGQSACNRNRLAVCDLSIPLNDERLKKAFHLSTSFELFEHIHRIHEDTFLRNLAYLSDYHLCSIIS